MHLLTLIITSLLSAPSSSSLFEGLFRDQSSVQPVYCSRDANPPPELARCSKLEDLIEGRGVIGPEDELEINLPPWANRELMRKGQMMAMDNIYSVLLGTLFGTFAIDVPDSADIAMFTGMSDNRRIAQRRYFATVTQIIVLYKDTLGAESDEAFFLSIKETNRRHFAAAQAARKKFDEDGYVNKEDKYKLYVLEGAALGGPFTEDLKNSDIPLSQREPPPSAWTNITTVLFNQQLWALIHFSFGGYPVLYPERMGLYASDDDIWAFNHLWAVLGHMMGIEDKYNMALQPDLKTQREVYERMHYEYIIPGLFQLEKNRDWLCCTDITMSAIGAPIIFSSNLQIFLYFKHVLRIPAPRVYSTLSALDKLVLVLVETTYHPQYQYNPAQKYAMNSLVLGIIYETGVKMYGTKYHTMLDRATFIHESKFQ